MRHRPAESNQLVMAMEGCVLPLSKKLRDLGIINFEELYRFMVQKESDLAQEKKFSSKGQEIEKDLAPIVGLIQTAGIALTVELALAVTCR